MAGPDEGASQDFIQFHHGTDLSCASDLLRRGVNQAQAAGWNGFGEFWSTTDHRRAEWFALSHPGSPPAACFEFELPKIVVSALLQMNPPLAIRHGAHDYEFRPASFALLNQHMANRAIVSV
jgi:hypothetical protein